MASGAEWMTGAGTLIGGIGSAYGAMKQADAMKDMFKLEKSKFDIDKRLIQKGIDDNNDVQYSLDKSLNNVYNGGKSKVTKASFDIKTGA